MPLATISSASVAPPTVAFDADLIAKYQRSGPRYTSYPTADRFTDAFGVASFRGYLERRARAADPGAWSLYVHLPFCATVCYYCGCNRIVTANKSRAVSYVDYLLREIALYGALLGEQRTVRQMHWGGGTPTFLASDDMARLLSALRSEFDFLARAELAIEVDPRTVDAAGVSRLARLRFNRMSLGVQDFDSDVQAAVNRIQSESQTLAVMRAARDEGFASLNVDLIYGLPRQTPERFDRTLDKVIGANPDRIALYSYAHLPELFKAQRQIDEGELPSAAAKLEILGRAIRCLTEAGYVHIGMDHFARPDDELAVAQREGRLQRNFQGYSTAAGSDLLAFGMSSIGAVGASYYQNHRDLAAYRNALDRNVLPIARGADLDIDDLLRRSVIHALMCRFALDMSAVEDQYAIDFDSYFEAELEQLETLARDGLIELGGGWIRVTPRGRLLVRNVAMVFDRGLRAGAKRARYSKVI